MNLLDRVRRENPAVYNISNYVSASFCADILLAAGAAPVMSAAEEEADELIAGSDAVCVNIGTLSSRDIPLAHAAAAAARRHHLPFVLDPAGAGASGFRCSAALALLADGDAVLRGNMSEFMALSGIESGARGVDAGAADLADAEHIEPALRFASEFAASRSCVAVISGPVDIISDGRRCAWVRNGVPAMARTSGSGCMLSALCAAFSAVESDYFAAAVGAAVTMGVAGELAEAGAEAGAAGFKNRIIDAVSRMDSAVLERMAAVEFR